MKNFMNIATKQTEFMHSNGKNVKDIQRPIFMMGKRKDSMMKSTGMGKFAIHKMDGSAHSRILR